MWRFLLERGRNSVGQTIRIMPALLIPWNKAARRILRLFKRNPANPLLVESINEIFEEELRIAEFIPEVLLLAAKEIHGPLLLEDKRATDAVMAERKLSGSELRKRANSAVKDNFREARTRLVKDRIGNSGNRVAKRLRNLEASLPSELLHDGHNDVIQQILKELRLLRTDIKEIKDSIPTIIVDEQQGARKKPWNASLKEAAALIKNNYREDQQRPPGDRKYTYMIDASNEFFNSHTFPHFPDLDAERLYENVKKY
jgi:hypothetical protein